MSRERSNERSSSRDDDRRSSRDADSDRGGRSRSRGSDDDRGGRSRDRDEDRGGRGDRGARSGFVYQPRTAEQARKRASMGGGDFDKVLNDAIKVWKPSDGDNRIRILPPTWKGADHYAYDVFVHYGIGPDRQTYLDLNKMKGEPDPITEERARATADGDDEYAKELRTTRRALLYLVDRNQPREGVQAWMMPQGLDADIMKISIDKESGEVLQIDDPENGYDVMFEKNGTGVKTKYEGVNIARRSSPLGDERWLEYAMDNPLPDQLQYFSYDHIARAFGGGAAQRPSGRDRDRDRDRDDERPAGRRQEGDNRRERVRDDDPPARGRESSSRDRRGEPDKPTWESVHQMTATELEDLIEDEKLDIDPKEAKDDDDLADWICDELKLTKRVEERTERRRVVADDPDDKLADMRRRRAE